MAASHERIVGSIAGWIVGGRFAPHAALPTESELCAALGASRTTVREALKTLAGKGFVSIAPRTGTRVRAESEWNLLDPAVVGWRLAAPVTPALVHDLTELRLLIEPPAGALAAAKAGARDRSRIAEAFAAMERAAADTGRYVEADVAFHRAILEATQNRYLLQLAPAITAVLRLSFLHSVLSPESARASLPDHRAVAEAIAAGDGEAARATLARIIMGSRADLETAIRRAAARAGGRRGEAADAARDR